MNRLEERLNHAAHETRAAINERDLVLPSSVGARRRTQRVLATIATAAVVVVAGFGIIAAVGGTPPDDPAATPPTSPADQAESSGVYVPEDLSTLIERVEASSELSELAFPIEHAFDDDLSTSWQDSSLGGRDAWIQIEFSEPVAIDRMTFEPLNSERSFILNHWIQSVRITPDDADPVIVALPDGTGTAEVTLRTTKTESIRVDILATRPGEPFGGTPAFEELAIAEIGLIGLPTAELGDYSFTTRDGTPLEGHTGEVVAFAGLAPTSIGSEPFDHTNPGAAWNWGRALEDTASTGRADDTVDGPELGAVLSSVPAFNDVALLDHSSEWSGTSTVREEVYLLLENGTDTMVYIGWEDRSVGHTSLALPDLGNLERGVDQDDFALLYRVVPNAVDFIADTASETLVVRFFVPADEYPGPPLAMSSDSLTRLFNDIVDVIDPPGGTDGPISGYTKADGWGFAPTPGELAAQRAAVDSAVERSTFVVQVADAIDAPPVTQCGGGDEYPNKTGTEDRGVFDTPEKAAADLVGSRPGWYPGGYIRFDLPSGAVVLAHPMDHDPNLFVNNIWLVRIDGGWKVDRWESTAC